MQLSKNWLNEHLSGNLDDINLSQILTTAGLEVEDVQDLSALSDLVVVGEIVEIEKHPDADRLKVCKVNVGKSSSLQIVCGAPNARLGIKVPCAKVGAKLSDFEIKKAKLRGVESFGMLCSSKEIGLSQESDGLLELNISLKAGEKIKDSLGLNDTIYTLSLTPNRADCLSIIGVAREVAALTSFSLVKKDEPKFAETYPLGQTVTVVDQSACPRYCSRQIKGVDNKVQTPDWLTRKIERGGIKSINPVVDITNFVLLELGQPLHAFDQKKISGGIEVRPSVKNEKLILLDDQEITLKGGELVIADDKHPLALAGIMGGLASSISSETNELFLESAYFDAVSIAGRARSFSLNTDSSHRFERGVDYENSLYALDRATQLIIEICGGQASEAIDLSYDLPDRKAITLRPKKVSSIMGINIAVDEIEVVLNKLSLKFKKQNDSFIVTPPSFRFDLKIEEDLIEEVIRIYGYDNIPALTPVAPIKMLEQISHKKNKIDIKRFIANLGYNEIISYSFISRETEEGFHSNEDIIELKNPIASQMNVMRSRIWGSHIEALTQNINRGQTQVRLFEVASTYKKSEKGFAEHEMLSGLVYGKKYPEQWGDEGLEVNFYDLKGDIESFSGSTLTFKAAKNKTPSSLHPGQAAEILVNNKGIGWLGQLHPAWQQKYEIPGKVYLFELKVSELIKLPDTNFHMPVKYQSVRRDISIIVDKATSVGSIVNAVYEARFDCLIEFYAFDVYEGSGIENDKKSIAFLILMQDTYKTLEDKEVNNTVDQVLSLLKDKFNVQLR